MDALELIGVIAVALIVFIMLFAGLGSHRPSLRQSRRRQDPGLDITSVAATGVFWSAGVGAGCSDGGGGCS